MGSSSRGVEYALHISVRQADSALFAPDASSPTHLDPPESKSLRPSAGHLLPKMAVRRCRHYVECTQFMTEAPRLRLLHPSKPRPPRIRSSGVLSPATNGSCSHADADVALAALARPEAQPAAPGLALFRCPPALRGRSRTSYASSVSRTSSSPSRGAAKSTAGGRSVAYLFRRGGQGLKQIMEQVNLSRLVAWRARGRHDAALLQRGHGVRAHPACVRHTYTIID